MPALQQPLLEQAQEKKIMETPNFTRIRRKERGIKMTTNKIQAKETELKQMEEVKEVLG